MTAGSAAAASLRMGFLSRAASSPASSALVVGEVTLTYAELSVRARQIAAAVLSRLPGPAERIGVFAYRSVTAYAGTLGALCAGAAFVPLNPKFPAARTGEMAKRAQLDAIIVDRLGAAQLPEVLGALDQVPVIVHVDADAANALYSAGIASVDASTFAPLFDLPAVLSDDLAYLLFTSGSTGAPKGVGITHANVLHYLSVIQRRLQLTPADRCSQTFDQTFDLSVHDLFLAWSAGACVVVMQPIELLAPVRFVARHQLTVWFSVPSVAALALRKGMLRTGAMPTLRYSGFCGEPLPDATARAWQVSAPNSVVDNLYGPTELTIACFAYRWEGDASSAVNGIVPIGRPFPELDAIVVDDALQPVPVGASGELLVGGPQTAPGYWLDADRTDECFIRLPFSPTRGQRFYRTGDRVVLLESGQYAFLGRVDHQIKVLGYRVELGEIEAVLMRDGGAVQAVAAGWPVEDGRALGIVAFVSGSSKLPAELIMLARRVLPAYMVPSRVVVLDEMPLNANGKIDRAKLLADLGPLVAA